jgi:hypothetical protein
MASEITTTQASTAIAQLWSNYALIARFANQVVLPYTKNVLVDANAKLGDRVNVQIMPTVSVGTVSSAGAVANTASSITSTTITVNSWRYAKVDIVDQVKYQSNIDLAAAFSQQFGRSLAEDIDNTIVALYTGFTTTGVGGDQPLDDAVVLSAVVTLDDTKIPEDDRTWIFSPRAKTNLINLKNFGPAMVTGTDKSPMITKVFGQLMGNRIVVTPLIATSANQRKNIYMHREGIGVAVQQNVKVEILQRTQLSTPIVGSTLFGSGVLRTDHGVVVSCSA